jgi:hypothetical protein
MFSIWWLLAALTCGIYLGMLLFALMQMSAGLPAQPRARSVRKHGVALRRLRGRPNAMAA